jgi:micrococcal nuclease
MRTKIRICLIIVIVIILSLLIGTYLQSRLTNWLNSAKKEAVVNVESSRQKIKIIRIVDGDMVEIETGEKVRYIGMDTPETKHPIKTVQCFGVEASEKNRQLVEGKIVEMEKDVSNTDKYGRLLRYIWLDGKMINEVLVTEGFARVLTYPPDVKYKDVFLAAEKQARELKKGLWGKVCN